MESSGTESSRLERQQSLLVGPVKMAALIKKSRQWCHECIRQWWEEQKKGGPIRVFAKITKGEKRPERLCTTIAVLQREFGIHDPVIMKKLKEQEATIAFLTQRMDNLTTEIHDLRRSLKR